MNKRPSIRQRLALAREAVRGIWQGPIYSSDPNLREFFGSPTTSTGVPVSEATALNHAAVWSALNGISGDVGALPLHMYRRLADGGKEKFTQNPLYRLVHDQPNPEMTSIAWRRTVQAHALSWGNGYSEIVRDGSGRPAQMWPITPDRVTPYRRGADSGLEYRILNRDGSDSFVPAADMLHIPGLGFDGIQGYSVIGKARESIGLGVAAERFGATLYGNGLAIGGVLSFPGPKPTELSDKNYVASLNSQHQGVDRAHKLLALYNGAKYERMNIPPNDAQFLETRKFQISEIARWFNLPPHKLGDLERATHSNIEQQTIDYYTGTLLPWLKTWEQELFLKLVPALERNIQFFEHVVDGLLRGDSQMRADAFSKQFSTASITPNEIRDTENRNPITGGDTAFVPLNTIPLNLVQDWFQADIDEKKAKAEQARRPPPTPDPTKAREIELLTEARDTARRCAQEAEDAKDIIAAELVKAQAEWAHARSQWDGERVVFDQQLGEAAERRETYSLELKVAQDEAGRASTQATEQTAEIERLTAQAMSLGTDLGTATRDLALALERVALIEADYQRVCEEKTTLGESVKSAGLALVSLEAERADLKSQTEGLSLDVVTSRRETVQALERVSVLEADATLALDVRAQEHDAHVASVAELHAAIGVLTQDNERTSAALLEATAAMADAEAVSQAVRQALEADVQRLTEARTHADEVNGAIVTELRGQIATVSQELAAATSALLDARTSIGALESDRDAQRETVERTERERVQQAASHATLMTRLAATQQAIRGTLVDAAGRLIAKETERARKAQATPDKLSKWVETFYPIHEDFCRVALKPAVRAMLIAQGVDVDIDRVLDRVVLAHIGESSRQLKGVLQDADVESLAPALERVLRRWEAERAEALADRIMKEAA